MTGVEIAALVLAIFKEALGIASDLIAQGVTGKKPEEVQATLHGLIDEHMKPWLPKVVAEADATFNTPGKE